MSKCLKPGLIVLAFLLSHQLYSQEAKSDDKNRINVSYGKNGLNFKTADDLFDGNLEFRFQFRFFTPYDSDPRTPEKFTAEATPTFTARRIRLKSNGKVFKPWLKYSFEYDLLQQNLLNAEFWMEKRKEFGVHVGRTKIAYTRERKISSGKQLLIERSIVNRIFTLDRQDGVAVYGNVGDGPLANFSYLVSAYLGTGIQDLVNDDENLLYMGRFQWNVIGGEMDAGEADADVDISESPKFNISFSAATNTSPYTRFSTSGGSEVDFFEDGQPGQYKVDQFVEDILFKWKGISLMHEYHRKKIEDQLNGGTTDMMGYLAQVGIFPHGLISSIPEQLQFAVRYAYVDPDTEEEDLNERDEFSVGLNWYFRGFRNRVSVDYSHLTLNTPVAKVGDDRFRVQWDISF